MMGFEVCCQFELESGLQSRTRHIMFIFWSVQNLQEVGEKKTKTGLLRRWNIRRRGAQHANQRCGCIVHVIRGCQCALSAMGTIVKWCIVHWSSHLISSYKKIIFEGSINITFDLEVHYLESLFFWYVCVCQANRALLAYFGWKEWVNHPFYQLSYDKLISLFALMKTNPWQEQDDTNMNLVDIISGY